MADDKFYQKADRKRKLQLPQKHQLTQKHLKLEHYSPTISEEPPPTHSEATMNVEKSPAILVEQPNADISDVEAEQHDTVRRKRVHSGSPPDSPPTSHESNSKSKRREAIHQKHLKRVKHSRKMKQESSSSSENDDACSSPESDMLRNLTESENKGLIKAFKRCFGKLCLAIKDPDKAAAELQAKGLLSCSMMESLLTSPESQQVKAIALVRGLKKRIKSRPVRVFAIIDVFLCNEILKEAGRELWNETGTEPPTFQIVLKLIFCFFLGNVCPDRTVCVLGHQLPPSDRPTTSESAINKSKLQCVMVLLFNPLAVPYSCTYRIIW